MRRGIIKRLARFFILVTFIFAGRAVLADASVTFLRLSDLQYLYQQAEVSKKITLKDNYEWRVGLAGESYEEQTNKDVGTSANIDLKLTKLLSENFYFKFEGSFGYSSGNTQLAISEFYSNSFFNPNELTLNLDLYEHIVLSAGNINQGFLNAPLLISSGRSFPGFKQKIFTNYKKHEFGLIGQQTVPTSKAFNIDRQDKEAVPSFYTATIFSDFSFSSPVSQLPTAKLNWTTNLSYFAYNDLPNVVAQDGRLYGHLFVDGTEAEAQFLYEFAGYLVNTQLELIDENNYSLGVRGYWADNVEAKTNDRLESIQYFATKNINNLILDVSFENFFKDSEASPAIYSASSYGRNNRKGRVYGAGIEFTKLKFRIEGRYYDIDTIVANSAVQGKRDSYYLGLETLYVEF